MPEGQFKEGIAGGRLAPSQYADNFSDLHPPLDHHEALVESRPLLFLLRRAVHERVPDRDRHSAVHPRDRDRQSDRLGQDHLRPEHSGRHVRPRLPDRDAVRGGLRARGGGGQAGADRPPAALRHRCGDVGGQAVLQTRRADRQEDRRGRRRACGARRRAPARALRPRRDDLRGEGEGRRPQRIRHRRLQEHRRFRAGRGRLRHRDRRHHDRARPCARPRRASRRPDRGLRRRVPRHGARRRQCAARRGRGCRRRRQRRRVHRGPSAGSGSGSACRSAAGWSSSAAA